MDAEEAGGVTDGSGPRRAAAVTGRDIDSLLGAVVAEVGEALGFWSADLWAFSGDADSLTCRAWWCREPQAATAGSCVGAVVPLDQSHDLRRLVLTAEIVERHADDELSPAEAAALTQAGFASRVDVPLLSGEEVLGVLSLAERRAVRRLTAHEHGLLASFSRLAAASLRAALLAEAAERRSGRLAGLLSSYSGMAASPSAADVAAAVHREAEKLLPEVGCTAEVVLRRDDGGYVRAGAGDDPAGGWRADALARQSVDMQRPEHGRTADGWSRLVVPLATGDRSFGYLDLSAPLRRSFRAEEVELAVLLAAQAAAALERARSFRSLQSRTATDTGTGLYGRWYFYERLNAEVARARRYREPLSLVLVELDTEREAATPHRHAHRDAVVAATAQLVQACLRDKVDVACRLAVGRFGLLLPNTPSGPRAAGLVAERIRQRAAGTFLSDDDLGALGRVTLSLGVAGFPDAAEDADELLSSAEERLATALAAGGDRVEPPLPDPEEDEAEEAGEPVADDPA